MSNETMLHVRIETDIKNEAAEALKGMGLNVSSFVRMALTRVAVEKELPFPISIPNTKTIAAMKESEEIGKRLEAKYKGVLFDVEN